MLNFKNFILNEKLHINDELDKYSDKIYNIIKTSDKKSFIFKNLPIQFNIYKLVINIKNLPLGIGGQLLLNKSYETKNGWIITIDLKDDFLLYNLKHELNHALRLTLIGKDKMISNLNHIRTKMLFSNLADGDIDYFFYIIYLSNDEEINAKISETHGYIKEVMISHNYKKLTKEQFEYILKESDGYKISEELINFNCEKHFSKFSKNELNKFFYLLEENKTKLDNIEKSLFRNIKLFIKTFKYIFFNKISFETYDDNVYKPKKGSSFYNKWINNQGEKLKRKLYSLYDHYT